MGAYCVLSCSTNVQNCAGTVHSATDVHDIRPRCTETAQKNFGADSCAREAVSSHTASTGPAIVNSRIARTGRLKSPPRQTSAAHKPQVFRKSSGSHGFPCESFLARHLLFSRAWS